MTLAIDATKNTAEHYKKFISNRAANERLLWGIFSHLGKPDGYLDVGCGDGWMVHTAMLTGVRPCVGIEASEAVRGVAPPSVHLLVRDLRRTITLNSYFGIVTCINVADEIDSDGARTLITNLVSFTSRYLVFKSTLKEPENTEHWVHSLEKAGLKYLYPLPTNLNSMEVFQKV